MPLATVSPQEIQKVLRSSEELELSAAAIQRLKWFLYAREHEDNVSLTCRHFGISRSTFLRWADRFDVRDPRTLEEQSRRPMRVRQSVVPSHVIDAIRSIRERHPTMNKQSVAECLLRETGITLSASTVGRIIARHGFFFATTKSHLEKRHRESDEQTQEVFAPGVPPRRETVAGADDSSGFLSILGCTA